MGRSPNKIPKMNLKGSPRGQGGGRELLKALSEGGVVVPSIGRPYMRCPDCGVQVFFPLGKKANPNQAAFMVQAKMREHGKECRGPGTNG